MSIANEDPIPSGVSRRTWLVILTVFALIALVPSGLGFLNKLAEFFHSYTSHPDGAFAIMPICNYLLASCGFLFLLVWATRNGMFNHVEGQSLHFLDHELADEQEFEQRGNG